MYQGLYTRLVGQKKLHITSVITADFWVDIRLKYCDLITLSRPYKHCVKWRDNKYELYATGSGLFYLKSTIPVFVWNWSANQEKLRTASPCVDSRTKDFRSMTDCDLWYLIYNRREIRNISLLNTFPPQVNYNLESSPQTKI